MAVHRETHPLLGMVTASSPVTSHVSLATIGSIISSIRHTITSIAHVRGGSRCLTDMADLYITGLANSTHFSTMSVALSSSQRCATCAFAHIWLALLANRAVASKAHITVHLHVLCATGALFRPTTRAQTPIGLAHITCQVIITQTGDTLCCTILATGHS